MKDIYKFVLILVVVVGLSFYFGSSPAKNVFAVTDHRGDVSGCTVTVTKITGVKEEGEDHGRTNGCRPTFKFSSNGAGYCPGGNCVVDVRCENGDEKVYEFKNPGISPDPCPPGSNWHGPGSPGRYPPIYGDLDFFLWKSRSDSDCRLVILLPKDFGTGECEGEYYERGGTKSPAEALKDLVDEWKKIRDDLHGSGDLAEALEEYDEIKKKMDIIKKQATVKISENQCYFPIYGDDLGFSYYDPDVNNTDQRITDPTGAKSKLVLCPLSPKMKSCNGFTLEINSSNERVFDRGRQVFKEGTPIEGSDIISCEDMDGNIYEYDIPDGYEYTTGECQ
ncbi:MAG: hypothetical protein PHX25_03110 [Candidatus Pacebacteria bacterium]|nr:hypothetical protein [Candidatus Paceibacterota bacterium]